MIVDFNKPDEEATGMHFVGSTLYTNKKVLDGVTFQNFPKLELKKVQLRNCKFENCKTIHFTDCLVLDCHMDKIGLLFADRTHILSTVIEHMFSNNDCVISVEDSGISGCTFRDVELREDSYFIVGFGDVWLDNCTFEDIRTERDDCELFFCERVVGTIFKRTEPVYFANENSCIGLANVKHIEPEDDD